MKNQNKIVVLWLIIVIGIITHTVLEVTEGLYFSELPEKPFADGIPVAAHVIYIVAIIIPLIFSVLTLFFKSKTFIWISLVYASLLALVNIFHVIEDGSLENITQLALLSFIPIINVVLVITLNKWRKSED